MAKRSSRSSKPEDLNRGAWTAMEDQLLSEYVNIHGKTAWNSMPQKIGLKRCGKSCRLRWLNYLRPDIKRGNISSGEEDLIIRLHGLLGNRWSLIAGRLPGRTDNEIKNYWNTHLSKKSRTSKTLSKLINKTRKSDRPAADDRLLKVTPVKVTAVRIRKGCNKYVHTHSNHEKTDSPQKLKTSISCSQLCSSTDISMAADPESLSVKIDGQYCFEDFGIEELQKSNSESFLRPTDDYSSGTGDWMDELQDFLLSEFKEEDFTHFS